VPEVKAIVARAGSDELGLDPMGLNQTDTFMVLSRATPGASPTRPGWPTSCAP
jgi:cobalt-zinc-cadmium resistance protein CzcA